MGCSRVVSLHWSTLCPTTFFVRCENKQRGWFADTWICYNLPWEKHLFSRFGHKHSRILALWFVDHHGECKTNRKLNSIKLEWHNLWTFLWVSSRESHCPKVFSPLNAFRYIVLFGSNETWWLPSKPSVINCAVASLAHPMKGGGTNVPPICDGIIRPSLASYRPVWVYVDNSPCDSKGNCNVLTNVWRRNMLT